MNKNELTITEFDQITLRGTTQIIKALIPFLSPREQKMIGIMVRIWELIMTLRFFEKDCIPPRAHSSNTDLINYIKKYCTPENQKNIDMLLNFMNMSEVMNMMNMFDDEKGNSNPLNGFLNNFGGAGSTSFGDSGGFANMFSENNLADIMNMFKTMSQASNNTSTVNQPTSDTTAWGNTSDNPYNSDTYDNNDIPTDSTENQQSSDNMSYINNTFGFQPDNLLQSMMNPQQNDLYEEFMEKLDQRL